MARMSPTALHVLGSCTAKVHVLKFSVSPYIPNQWPFVDDV